MSFSNYILRDLIIAKGYFQNSVELTQWKLIKKLVLPKNDRTEPSKVNIYKLGHSWFCLWGVLNLLRRKKTFQ